jgi:hypothetical protein
MDLSLVQRRREKGLVQQRRKLDTTLAAICVLFIFFCDLYLSLSDHPLIQSAKLDFSFEMVVILQLLNQCLILSHLERRTEFNEYFTFLLSPRSIIRTLFIFPLLEQIVLWYLLPECLDYFIDKYTTIKECIPALLFSTYHFFFTMFKYNQQRPTSVQVYLSLILGQHMFKNDSLLINILLHIHYNMVSIAMAVVWSEVFCHTNMDINTQFNNNNNNNNGRKPKLHILPDTRTQYVLISRRRYSTGSLL